MPKVVCTDNYARESVAERLVAENLDEESAKLLAERLNGRRSDGEWYAVKSDDYTPWRGMEELV